MSFNIHKVQSYGSLPKPYTISDILDLRSDSNKIIELYDTNPNLVALLNTENNKIVLKRFGWRSQFHFLISPFMNSRARMSWDIASILYSKNLTPKPLYVYTKKKFSFIYENFFITEAIDPHLKFRKFIKEEIELVKIEKVLQNLAIAISKMHDLGIYHRDLTTGNFLIDSNLYVFIVDLNRARNVGKLLLKQRLKDLSKIYFNNTEIFTQNDSIKYFFYHYSKASGITINWEERYLKIRKKVVKRRKKSKEMKKHIRFNSK